MTVFVPRFPYLILMLCLSISAYAVDVLYDIPPPGKRIDIGGYKLHINCQGEGSPTVVLDAGLGDWSVYWSLVQKRLAANTKVCSYDRAGYGWSDPGPRPRSSEQIANELHALLEKAGLSPPFIIVGHSFGGFTARVFAASYPKEIGGVVLIDSSHPGTIPYPKNEDTPQSGVSRSLVVMEPIADTDTSKLDPDVIPIVSNDLMRTKSIAAALTEYQAMALSVNQVQKASNLGDIPLAIITRGKHEGNADAKDNLREKVWQSEQHELLNLSRKSYQIIASKSGHHVYLDEPELVIDAIRSELLEQRDQSASFHQQAQSLLSQH